MPPKKCPICDSTKVKTTTDGRFICYKCGYINKKDKTKQRKL